MSLKILLITASPTNLAAGHAEFSLSVAGNETAAYASPAGRSLAQFLLGNAARAPHGRVLGSLRKRSSSRAMVENSPLAKDGFITVIIKELKTNDF